MDRDNQNTPLDRDQSERTGMSTGEPSHAGAGARQLLKSPRHAYVRDARNLGRETGQGYAPEAGPGLRQPPALSGFWEQIPPAEAIIGPSTDAHLTALRHLEYIAAQQSAAHAPPRRIKTFAEALRRSLPRLSLFAVSSLLVFITGLAIQAMLIHRLRMSHDRSYIVQTVISIQLSYLLSRYLTWRDRATPFLGTLGRFNVQQLALTGLGLLAYAGLEQSEMSYVSADVVVTAFVTPVAFLVSHNWSMRERESRVTFLTLPWPLFLVLAVQTALSARLIWTNTAYIDEATYLYAGSQELHHWINGIPVQDYQDYFSGSPAIYPPLGAMADSLGGLAGARILSLAFMLGTTSLLYLMSKRFFGPSAAFVAVSLFASLGVTQYLSAFATYDPMALFLLALASYLAIGREHAYKTLADVALSTVFAAVILALANACKYATALWDPVVIGLALCAPRVVGYSWRYGLERATRFAVALASALLIGIAIGKAKYIQGILYTTVDRSSNNVGMGQPPELVFHDTWQWVGVILVLAFIGLVILLLEQRINPTAIVGILLFVGLVAAPLNQARIGTTTSLQKHVVFGAWFGCILAGYGISRLLRYRWITSSMAVVALFGLSALYLNQAYGLYHTWSRENPAFIAGLKTYVRPGDGKYLIEGYADIPAFYVGPTVTSLQWKESGSYSYLDPQTGVELRGPAAVTMAIRNKVFSAMIINFGRTTATEIADDDAVVSAVSRYGGYRVAGKLPPSYIGSDATYTVWERIGK